MGASNHKHTDNIYINAVDIFQTTSYKKIKQILEDPVKYNFDPSIIFPNSETALIWSCFNNFGDAVKLLLTMDCLPHHVDNHGNTALSWACCNGMKKESLALLTLGCDPIHEDIYGNTALSWACSSYMWGIVYKMIRRENRPRQMHVMCDIIATSVYDTLRLISHTHSDVYIRVLFMLIDGVDPPPDAIQNFRILYTRRPNSRHADFIVYVKALVKTIATQHRTTFKWDTQPLLLSYLPIQLAHIVGDYL
jgi:hypothetical protein